MSTIVQVLEKIAANTNHDRIQIFSYASDFEDVWDIDAFVTCIQNNDESRVIVIIWDGIPFGNTGSIDTTRYLTPIDWAVAFLLAVHRSTLSENDHKQYPNLRILIFDLASHSISHADSVKFVNQFPMFIPWMRLFRPLEADALLDNILGRVSSQDGVPSMAQWAQKENIDLGVVKNIWAAALTRTTTPGDHHAIANLVGPLLLLDDEERQKNSHVEALRSLLKEIGLLPFKDQTNDELKSRLLAEIEAVTGEPPVNPLLKKGNPWIKPDDNEWNIRLQRILNDHDSLSLILVDDQYTQGWGNVLCLAVGADYNEIKSDGPFVAIGAGPGIIVKASDSVDWLVDLLKNAEEKRFALHLDQKANNDGAEILFLDLRLFSGKPIKEEAEFFLNLCNITEKFADKENLPWRNFDYGEIGRVRTWCEEAKEGKAKREDNKYREALTFLPRIIALTDMSLPIILFSSTGKRDITEKFNDYKNIITVFDKPKFTVDIPEDIAEQTKAKFIEAMKEAFKILQGRRAIREIQSAAKQPPECKASTEKYVEIFIDESGVVFHGHFVVGGLILVHDSEQEAEALHAEMQNTRVTYSTDDGQMISRNLVWCGKNRLDKRLSKKPDKEERWDEEANILRQILPEITGTLNKHSLRAFPIVLRAEVKNTQGLNVLHNEHLDNLYLKLVKELLDAALYELLPWHAGRNQPLCCKIIAGTRTRDKGQDKNGNPIRFTFDEKEQLRRNFGPDIIPGKTSEYYRALTETSFIPLVSEIIHSRPDTHTTMLKIEGAVGRQLADGDYCDKYIRHAHYLADLIAHYDIISISKQSRDVFKDYFLNDRMIDVYDTPFKAAMDASKFIESKDVVNALLSAYYAKRKHDAVKYPESIIPKVLSHVIQKANGLDGDQFNQFSDALDVWYRSGFNAPPRKAQTQRKFHQTQKSNSHAKAKITSLPSTVANVPVSKERLEVVAVIYNNKNQFKKLKCKRNDGAEVWVNQNQTQKAKLPTKAIIGTKLKAKISEQNNILYAQDIEIAK